MNLQESNWSEYKLPCPQCGGSDPVAMNTNGTAKCFSCGTWFTDYKKPTGTNTITTTKPKDALHLTQLSQGDENV